ncbi:hypothetical protein HUF18_17265 [Thalassolituus sp. ST750PaO-4]|uniref:hypothetical protein n=1 Tax=Thalassolituus sp. ST750PaO-4 TaxID=2742965 RepID=UPI000C61BF0F|nr:hypothetical protein [Thalassolituus sp. ST750PaO-4]MCA6061532.1 hypothetical protein [Thalassolituus sp. ST750PaO-4]PIQ39135.1 MAG: hypothetical protein COW58_13385 [Thalassolituus sp. CG17_big_fil_post_rev_8_21_14_2_50_53_8]
MVKKTLLSLAIAATTAGLAGCNISSVEKHNNEVDSTPVDAGKPGVAPARVAPVFSAGNKDLPLFNDLLFADAAVTDGTASADDTQAPVTTALNSIDGAPVSTPIDIEFNAPVDADSLSKPFTAVLIKLRNSSNDPAIDALDIKSIAANSPLVGDQPNVLDGVDQPVFGVDYTVSFLDLDDGNTPTLRINLLKPLEERTKYVVALTSHITAGGEAIGASAEYELLSGNAGLPSSALLKVREAIQAWEGVAKAYLAGAAARLQQDAATAAENDMPEAAAQATAAAQLASSADVVLSYAFTTGGTTSTLKMIAAPEMYVRALAAKPDTAKKLYQAVLLQQNAGDEAATAAAYVATAIVPAATTESIALDNPPTEAQIAEVEATATFKANIVATASSAPVVGGVTASLYTPEAQAYEAIPGVALTPAQVFAGTPLAADSVTQYVQGSLTLPVGLSAPVKTNAQALASSDPVLQANAVKLSMASDAPWSADPALNPPSDNKVFNPATGTLTATGVTAVKDEEGNVTGYTGGMTNVTYRYPLVNLDKTENVPVLVTLPGDYSGLGEADCTALQAGAGYPVIVYLHGITSDRTSSLGMAQAAAFKGCYATVAMDMPLHGVAPLASDRDGKSILNSAITFNVEQATTPFGNAASVGNVEVAERHYNIASASNARVDMVFGNSVETSLGKSGEQFINLANMNRLRDNLRQAVVDNVHLLASLDNIAAAHGVTFDTDKVYVAGLSLGAIVGTTLTTVVNDPNVQNLNAALPEIKGTLLASPGASLPKMLENSPAFAPTVLSGLNLAQDSSSLQKYEGMLQAALNSVDPIGFAAELGAQTTPVLMYNVVGGGACPNFTPFDQNGAPTANASEMVGADCSDGPTQRLPSKIALAFQGKYPSDHVVPNFDYFGDADSNPFSSIMSGLTFELGDMGSKVTTPIEAMPSSASALVGTNPLAELAGLKELDETLDMTNSGGQAVIPFDKATHVTFAAADDTNTFTTMITQMLTFFGSNGAALNPAVNAGVKPAE